MKSSEFLMESWSLNRDIREFSFAELVELPVVSRTADGTGARPLRSCEMEQMLCMPSEASNGMPKIPGEKLKDRELRRALLLARSIPVQFISFAVASVIENRRNKKDPLNLLPSDAHGAATKLASLCEYRKFLENRGVSLGAMWVPDENEVNPVTSSFLAAKLQARKTSGSNAPFRAVPSGLDELEHFEAGLIAQNPLEIEPKLPLDLEFAIEKVSHSGDGKLLEKWRSEQFGKIKAISEELSP